MHTPELLTAQLAGYLRAAGDPGPITGFRQVGGGDINQAARIETPEGRYFVKWHDNPPPRFFECEAAGLQLLHAAGTVRAPQVIGCGTVSGRRTAFLIMEWIETGLRSHSAAEALGRGLARQHLQKQVEYGLDHNNYTGRLPQLNQPSDSWIAFYGERRLGAQRDLAAQNGHLPPQRARLLDALVGRLDRWIDERACQPSLLHGDLWGGNWMAAANGEPVVIDPAVYIGDREADLAMTALFGGFPTAFYNAYAEAFPLTDGYEERQPLYQLYYLLCHLNLFGERYGGSVDSILRRYLG